MDQPNHSPLKWEGLPEAEAIPVLGDLSTTNVPLPVAAEGRDEEDQPPRVLLPAFLFVATCFTTFWAGSVMSSMGGGIPGANFAWWQDALIYMSAVMGILLAHEMGHFIQAVRYGVPASLPFFIPMPAVFTPTIGTMGAVIGLQGMQANRKELFDIGLTGPIAGLVVALPVTAAGILLGEAYVPVPGALYYNYADPLVVQWMIGWLRPDIVGGNLNLNCKVGENQGCRSSPLEHRHVQESRDGSADSP